MRRLLLLLLLPSASLGWSAFAPVRAFPQSYAGLVRGALAADPLYGSRLLVGFRAHAAALAGLPSPQAARGYLETAVAGPGRGPAAVARVRGELEAGTLAPEPAAALLLANALARPEQFRETLDGLEDVKPGLGARAAEILGRSGGGGDARVIAALRSAARRVPRPSSVVYGPDGRLEALFDGSRR